MSDFANSSVLDESTDKTSTHGPAADGPRSQFQQVDFEPKKRWPMKIGMVVLLLAAIGAFLMYRGERSVKTPTLLSQIESIDPTSAGSAAQAASAPVPPPTTLSMVLEEVRVVGSGIRDLIAQHQSRTDERIDRLSQDVAALTAAYKEQAAARDAAQRAAPTLIKKTGSQPKTAAAKPSKEGVATVSPKLLSVDIWDGQPSAAVGNTADRRVRFLNPSDTVANVSMVNADPTTQTATLQIGERTVTLQRDQ